MTAGAGREREREKRGAFVGRSSALTNPFAGVLSHRARLTPIPLLSAQQNYCILRGGGEIGAFQSHPKNFQLSSSLPGGCSISPPPCPKSKPLRLWAPPTIRMNSGGLATPSLPPIAEDPPPSGARLPRPFLQSLRILFEILDDQRKGTVHISEIESRWGRGGSGVAPQEDQEIPAGVLQALQQVAEPCGGFLSFPRLVAGLRIALFQNEEGAAEEVDWGSRGAAQVKKTSRTRK
ncbi:suppressor APC domain-containing protein 2 [Crotalus adamanteus]|uniref:Suppressor APC domain-containing protein 2 n=1 Tax=Crotalus adamanteus TaxID=8729 RepID=A0AAW1BVJ6_CROAD